MCFSDVNMLKLPCMSRFTWYFSPLITGGTSDGLHNAILRDIITSCITWRIVFSVGWGGADDMKRVCGCVRRGRVRLGQVIPACGW